MDDIHFLHHGILVHGLVPGFSLGNVCARDPCRESYQIARTDPQLGYQGKAGGSRAGLGRAITNNFSRLFRMWFTEPIVFLLLSSRSFLAEGEFC